MSEYKSKLITRVIWEKFYVYVYVYGYDAPIA